MAETKTGPKKAKAKSSSAKSNATGKPRRTSSSRKPKARPSSSRTASRSRSKSSSREAPTSKPKAALETVEETAKNAGGTVGHAVSKAKVPLMAGGAALAAGAGGLALGARQSHRKSGLGQISSKDLAKAARKAGDVGAQIGEVALEVRRARETTNGHSHRSPIEVVLQGLTSRRARG